jgi:hypothetical protein
MEPSTEPMPEEQKPEEGGEEMPAGDQPAM